jgi:hypothetical protein
VTVEQLSETFLRLLREEIGPLNYERACERNRCESSPHVCHSHDFCDANMVMAAAFAAHGTKVDVDNDVHTALWTGAWHLAFATMVRETRRR